jgi:hypothetical protein
MAAYSPRTDLLTPSVAPDTQGYGPGLTAGMNNFSRLMEMGITNQRQDDRDQLAYERKTGMVDRSEGRADKKDLMSKSEQSDFAAGAWESIKMQMPDIISPDLNEKFSGGSLGAKQGLLLQAQARLAAAMKSEMEAKERAAKAAAASQWTKVPNTNYMTNGLSQTLPIGWTGYGAAAEGSTPAKPYGGMFDGHPINLEPGPTGPNYFTNLPYAPRSITESALGLDDAAAGQTAPGLPAAPPAAAPRRRDSNAANYYSQGRP